MKRTRILVVAFAILAAFTMTFGLTATAFADDHAHITVTVNPLFLSITNTPNTWTVNGITVGKGVAADTKYYANPLGDGTVPSATVLAGECYFNVSNAAGATTCDLTVTCGAFTGGGMAMTNSDDGSNGATTYGMYSWYQGMTYTNKVVVKAAGSDETYTTGLAAGASLLWGAEIETRTDAATSATASTGTLTITATEH